MLEKIVVKRHLICYLRDDDLLEQALIITEKMMSIGFDFKKLRRLINIYAVVQIGLVVLLIYVAMNFQIGLNAAGRGELFIKSIIITLLMQLAMFYPVYKFASREAVLAVDAVQEGLTPEELKSQRNKRLIGDVIKAGVFCFYLAFTLLVSSKGLVNTAKMFVLSMIFFNFILTYLSYFQCFNFAAKREMKLKEV